MSHFTTIAIIPRDIFEKGEADTRRFIEEIMDPFCEHNEVEPYKKPCYTCKGTKINALEYSRNFGEPCDEEDECDENGEYITTYNPDSKWDWYRIGGRWNGEIVNNVPASEDNGFNFSVACETFELNSIEIRTLINTKYPNYIYDENPDGMFTAFSVITPDGEWIEKGKMGSFAIVTDAKEKSEWIKGLKSIYNKYEDDYAVLLDCHI